MAAEQDTAYLFAMWLCYLVAGKDGFSPYMQIENKIELKVGSQ